MRPPRTLDPKKVREDRLRAVGREYAARCPKDVCRALLKLRGCVAGTTPLTTGKPRVDANRAEGARCVLRTADRYLQEAAVDILGYEDPGLARHAWGGRAVTILRDLDEFYNLDA